jgi:hypothetical protein
VQVEVLPGLVVDVELGVAEMVLVAVESGVLVELRVTVGDHCQGSRGTL